MCLFVTQQKAFSVFLSSYVKKTQTSIRGIISYVNSSLRTVRIKACEFAEMLLPDDFFEGLHAAVSCSNKLKQKVQMLIFNWKEFQNDWWKLNCNVGINHLGFTMCITFQDFWKSLQYVLVDHSSENFGQSLLAEFCKALKLGKIFSYFYFS